MMQKITKDNYSEVFNGLSADLDAVTRDVIDTTKLRNALEDKRKGAEENVKNNSVLQIGIVGQVKAGKSSFLNSLFFNGDNVLPRASTPMTAGLTVLEYGEENVFTVDYYSQTEWNTFVAKNKEYEELVSDLRQRNPDTPIEAMLGDIDEELKSAHELVEQCGAAAQGKIGRKAENQTFSGVEG
ncbi:MAG: dynamin family protein, partial [Marinilabiliaceae bacterium]